METSENVCVLATVIDQFTKVEHREMRRIFSVWSVLGTLLAILVDDGLVQQALGLLQGEHARQLEEAGLHEHVDALAEAEAVADGAGPTPFKHPPNKNSEWITKST